ncbi:MAG: hypothetical protein ACWA5Q_09955 [bacterium]
MTVHLVAPGLLGPLPDIDIGEELAAFKNIRRLLTRSERKQWQYNHEQTLFKLFGMNVALEEDQPTGAIQVYGESGTVPEGFWLNADPVMLQADNDRLLLFDASILNIEANEAMELVNAFNAHFGCDAITLHALTPDHWYLSVEKLPQIKTSPLVDVVGRNVNNWLPTGSDAQYWQQVNNEAQMLFFAHPVNEAREARGYPPVSGIWLSGVGELPQPGRHSLGACYGDNALMRGMARLHNLNLPRDISYLKSGTKDVVGIFDVALRAVASTSLSSWQQAMKQLDQMLGGLMRNKSHIQLYDGAGHCYQWQPSCRWKLWRNNRVMS